MPLDATALEELVAGPNCGAVVIFAGRVRGRNAGRTVLWLDYEAYAPLAVSTFECISREAAEKWPDAVLAIAHRVGRLEIGELAVVVAAAAPHRDAAFAACRYAIDVLKERAPIWKKEVATDGEYWVEDHA